MFFYICSNILRMIGFSSISSSCFTYRLIVFVSYCIFSCSSCILMNNNIICVGSIIAKSEVVASCLLCCKSFVNPHNSIPLPKFFIYGIPISKFFRYFSPRHSYRTKKILNGGRPTFLGFGKKIFYFFKFFS